MKKVKTLGLMVAVAMLVVGMAPLALAEEATGSATGGNLTPEVTSVTAPSSVDPTEHNFPCTVRDNNTLADIDNVKLILYTTDATESGEDNIANHYTYWFDTSENTWHCANGSQYVGAGGSYPDDLSVQSDNYNFAVKLSEGAKAGADWNAIWIAVDDNAASDNNSTTFEVAETISLSIDIDTQTFSGDPGNEGLPAIEEPGYITCTVGTGSNFDIKTMLFADWTGTAHSQAIGTENTHAEGDENIDLTTEHQNVWTNVTFGEGVERTITYTLDLPVPLRDDVYTVIFYVNVTKHT